MARRLPYKIKDDENTTLPLSKIRNDIVTRRMFLCATNTILLAESIDDTPTTTVEKKNLDRSISRDRRAISDLRSADIRFHTQQYYHIVAPSIYGLTRRVMSLVHTCPGFPLKVTKRDAAPSFRLLRLRPDLSLVLVTEFPSDHVHLEDLVCFYLAMPYDWNGSPAHFAFFGDAITTSHVQHGLCNPATLLLHLFRSVLNADGGIFAESNVPGRLFDATHCWGGMTRGILGMEGINADKLDEEGACES